MSMIGKSVGNYQIRTKLGEGGMGAVYMGEHPLIGKKVAIKVLLEEFASNESIVNRFFNEAKAVNDIGHANIVDIIDFGKLPLETGTVVYLVMELLDGQSLSGRMSSVGVTFDETRHILRQCCSALAASHKKGIVHRDLKPDNLYLCPRGGDKNFVKVLDFGIAKLTANTGNQTRTGTIIGTPAYMSPEQCAGRGRIDHRSDVYSLGVVMYEMLTGKVPFMGEGFGDIVVKQLTEAPPAPRSIKPEVPAALEKVVLKALEKKAEDRFQTMEDFAVALGDPEAFANGTTPKSQSATQFVFQPLFREEKSEPHIVLSDIARGKPGFVTDNKKAERAASATSISEPHKPRTTLSGAASEVREKEKKRSRMPLAAAAVLVVVGGSAVGVVATRGNNPAPAAVATPSLPSAAITPPPEPMVSIALRSEPTGASVVRPDQDNAVIGSTPMVLKLRRGAPSYPVQLRLDGYKPQMSTIIFDHDKEIQLTLAREEAKVDPAAAVPAKKKSSRRPTAPAAPQHDNDDDLRTLPPVF
jgi:serine/threonine-protein kinase